METMSGLNNNYYSDYGSGSSSNSSTSRPIQGTWSSSLHNMGRSNEHPSITFNDLVMGRCTLEDIMRDFQLNGTDSPYTPDEDKTWTNQTSSNLAGLGPSNAYLRQKSWPEPERTPSQRLPRPASDWISSSVEFKPTEFVSSTPIEELTRPASDPAPQPTSLTQEQVRVLNSLPNNVLFSILQELEQNREGHKRNKKVSLECRFCKNNGERESYYRSHALKDGGGRVTCPVLRAFVCARCGARGDRAHTIKYCPLSTADERLKSAAMMRSVRMASGRRRHCALAPPAGNNTDNYVMFGETTPSVISDSDAYNSYAMTTQLDPLWAALEQKLML